MMGRARMRHPRPDPSMSVKNVAPKIARFASALSTHPTAPMAEEQVVQILAEGLGGVKPDLLVVFVSHHHGSAIDGLGPRLASRTGARHVIGCTGESIIGPTREVEHEPALSAWAAYLPETFLRPFSVTAAAGPEETVLFSCMPDVRDAARASLLLLADPYSFPTDEFLKRLNAELPGVPAMGGMASGGMGPGQNLIFNEEGRLEEGAVGIVLEGAIELRTVVSQGCRPVGRPWVVTASEGQLVQKLGGKPAVDILMATLQDLQPNDQKLFQRAPFVGLAIDPTKSNFEPGDFLVRGIVGMQAEERALAIADVPRRGATLQFLVRDAESASEDLGLLMRTRAGGGPAEGAPPNSMGALIFSCNGRGSRLFDSSDHDVSAVRGGLAPQVPVAGFFAMGEIGPVGGRNFLHGFTASVAVFRPRT
jgi:small ligand-binding sensory domain FIST